MDKELDINFRSLEDVVVCAEAAAPVCVRAVTPAVDPKTRSTAGPMKQYAKQHLYVRIDALPKDLAERVRMAIEHLSWG